MEIVRATLKDAVEHTDALCELVWSTGAPSYAYHFSERTVFDALVAESLKQAGTLFGWDAMHLAIDDGELLGMVIAFEGLNSGSVRMPLLRSGLPLSRPAPSARMPCAASSIAAARRAGLTRWCGRVCTTCMQSP